MEAKGRADAEQMAKKAEAFQQYKDGAMVDMLLEKLPLVRDIKLQKEMLLQSLCQFIQEHFSSDTLEFGQIMSNNNRII